MTAPTGSEATPKAASARLTVDRRTLPPVSVTLDDDIMVRGHNLATELIGQVSFTHALLLDIVGIMPSELRVRMVAAILVALMEHGITPSTLATRLVLDGAPESLQGAVAAGLLATGSRFLGTIEQSSEVIAQVLEAEKKDGGSLDNAAYVVAQRLRAAKTPVPGVGHNLHSDVDPRVKTLLQVASTEEVSSDAVEAYHALAAAASRVNNRKLLPNTAGLIGALLLDLGYQPREARGFALIARCAGLVAHCSDERERPIARRTWVRVHHQVSHVGQENS
jgi:citrate synthase